MHRTILLSVAVNFICGQVDNFNEVPVETIGIVGYSSQLNCSYHTTPGYTVAWINDKACVLTIGKNSERAGFEIIGEDSLEFNLLIPNTTIDHESYYTCGSISDVTKRAVAKLWVIDSGPSCDVYPSHYVEVGTEVMMNCSIPKGAPPGELVWYDDNGDGQRGGNKSTNLWTKVFTKEDNGTRLNCELDHKTLPPRGGNRVNCKDDRIIIVQYPYVVNISNALSSILVEGGSYIAECTIEDIGTPSTLFRPLYWVGPHEEIYDDDILVITNVSRDGAGVYKCIAENKYLDGVTIGTGSATVSLDVQCK
ncbi:cell adhesion molecule 4-like [Glandiceps talaboti]